MSWDWLAPLGAVIGFFLLLLIVFPRLKGGG